MKKVYYIIIAIILMLALGFTFGNKVFAEGLFDFWGELLGTSEEDIEFEGKEINISDVEIGNPAAQRPSENIFCIDEGTKIYTGKYKKNAYTINKDKANMIAYIWCNGVADANRNSEHPASYNVRQEAIWSVLNEQSREAEAIYPSVSDGTSYFRRVNINEKWWQGGKDGKTTFDNINNAPDFVKLYKEAKNYASFIANKIEFSVNKKEGKIQSNNSNIYITGPYNVTFTSNDYTEGLNGKKTLTDGSVSADISDQNKNTGVWISNINGDVTKIESGVDFYIAIDTSKVNIDKTKNCEILLEYSYDKYNLIDACKWERIAESNTDPTSQLLGSFKAEKETISGKLELTVPKLIPPIEISFKKVDTNGQKLDSAEFSMEVLKADKTKLKTIDNATKEGDTYKFNYQPESFDKFYTYIYEKTVPGGYALVETIGDKVLAQLTWEFDSTTNKLVCKDINYGYAENWDVTNASTSDYQNYKFFLGDARNFAKIDKITLLKRDLANGEGLADVKFKVTIDNVVSINGANTVNNKYEGTIEVDEKGEYSVSNIIIADLTKDVIITLTEESTPIGYKKLDGTIKITIKRTNETDGKYKYEFISEKATTISDEEFNTTEGVGVKYNNNTFEININNKSIMNLGGIVWQDLFEATKDGELIGTANIFDKPYDLDGKTITEGLLEEVTIKLYKDSIADDNLVTEDAYGNKLTTEAGKNGNTITYKNYKGEECTYTYEYDGQYVFPSVERGDYIVVFEYNGVKYEIVEPSENLYACTDPKESKAIEEVGREELNSNFSVISGNGIDNAKKETYGKATDIDGQNEKDLVYDNVEDENDGTWDAKIRETSDMKIYAKSTKYNFLTTDENCKSTDWKNTWDNEGKIDNSSYALDINSGLIERLLDLSIGTNVENAEVNINGKLTTYNYDEILNGALMGDRLKLGETITDNTVIDNEVIPNYNLYLYESDYNYRIDDYINNALDTDVIDQIPENEYDTDEKKNAVNSQLNAEQLEVYVTYKVIINNQSYRESNDIKVLEIEDHYTNEYNYVGAYTNKECTEQIVGTVDNMAEGKITIKGDTISQNIGGENKQYIEIYLKFKVKDDVDLKNVTDAKNFVEISSYYTSEGLIDHDSAPGNAFISSEIHYEDDTDAANGINISIKDTKVREISGYVWDDGNFSDSDGIMEDKDIKVDDVIVQLIEIKDLKIGEKTYQFEYIWQETRSGNNNVKKLSDDGNSIVNYYVDENTNGQYTFKGFIPGNYIIRFIYGDGTTYDLTENIQKYNGQDYKSTIDPCYKEEWYNNSEYYARISVAKDKENYSVARDNEARRLKVMSYTSEIDSAKQAMIDLLEQPYDTVDKDKLEEVLIETWMCAETSKINVSVDTSDKSNVSDTESVTSKIDYENKFTNVNFGLAERPKLELNLEKHIKSLSLKSNDGTPIVDAKLGNNDKLEGLKDGLTMSKSTRSNRGYWKIETDLEELAQGAQLNAIYNYTVGLTGDAEYLSQTLVNESKKAGYSAYLEGLEAEVKNNIKTHEFTKGTYLSDWYYTRDTSSSSISNPGTKVVLTNIVIEEALNNDMLLDINTVEDTGFKNKDITIEAKPWIRNIWKSNPESEQIELKSINTNNVVTTKTPIEVLNPGESDSTRELVVSTTLSSGKEINIPSYIAEIKSYTIAGGSVKGSSAGNLTYIHSDDTDRTLDVVPENYDKPNESDEFWGESIIITKPTGSDKLTEVQLIAIISASVAVVATGIILIKKFIITKNV